MGAAAAVVAVSALVSIGLSGDQETAATPGRGEALVSGAISAPGGTYLKDRLGRVVVLHGVNAVYKRAPYELFRPPASRTTSRRLTPSGSPPWGSTSFGWG